jgi:uncharacterized protein (TIGR02246 family)
MKKSIYSTLALALACAIHSGATLRAAEPDPQEAALNKTSEAFVEAFHKGDAKAVAALWTADGDYVSDTGRVFKGRKAIEENFTEFFAANKGLQLRIEVADLKFPTPDVAIEDGTTLVLAPDGGEPSRARYSNVFVKKEGQWLLASVRESPDPGPSKYEFLRDLEWVVGEWVDEGAVGELGHVSFEWAPGQNFIIATRTVDFKESSVLHSTQWIGWDPNAKQIRSWNFQADGGFGESTWTKDGNKWVIKTTSTVADGGKVTSTNVVTPVDADTLSFQSKDQKVNGEAIPDTKEMKMKRAQ